MKKAIAVYTSTRADFGLLKPLIEKLVRLEKFDVRLFVTGTHLDLDFGKTISEIENFFPKEIFYRVPHSMKEDPKLKNLIVMSEALKLYSEALVENPPDLAIVLGDRFEAFTFGIACASLNIPIAHMHGGELTLGAIDDKFRHCLTKLSNWHFVACESYRKRVIQLGEAPDTVFNVGALGVDNALNQILMTIEQVQKDLGLNLKSYNELYLFTFHPETNSIDYGAELLNAFLLKLGERLVLNNAFVIVTGVNGDPGADKIRAILNKFCTDFSKNVFFKESLGLIRYLSVMKASTAVLGNSSSGILEAFSLKAPAVNVGFRQTGREREIAVIDLPDAQSCFNFNFDSVVRLKSELVANKATNSIFGTGHTSALIAEKIDQILQQPNSSASKEFFDL